MTGRSPTTSLVQADVRSSALHFGEQVRDDTPERVGVRAANYYCTVKMVLAPAMELAPATVVPNCT